MAFLVVKWRSLLPIGKSCDSSDWTNPGRSGRFGGKHRVQALLGGPLLSPFGHRLCGQASETPITTHPTRSRRLGLDANMYFFRFLASVLRRVRRMVWCDTYHVITSRLGSMYIRILRTSAFEPGMGHVGLKYQALRGGRGCGGAGGRG